MKKYQAFSLLEASIILVVIAIIVSSIIEGADLVAKTKLKNARSLTLNSPVTSTENLIVWYETSLEDSFDELERFDGQTVSTWYDINSNNIVRNNATQSTDDYKPLFKERVINGGISAVRFDGSDDYLEFDGTKLINTGYTIFVVEQRRAAVSSGISPLMGGTTGSANQNLHLIYRYETTMRFGQYSNDMDYTIGSYTTPTPRIHTFLLSTTDGKEYWLNGGDSADASSSSQTDTLTSYTSSALGKYLSNYFNGDLAEIIIFNRSLTTTERQAIESYLSKKYNITIS